MHEPMDTITVGSRSSGSSVSMKVVGRGILSQTMQCWGTSYLFLCVIRPSIAWLVAAALLAALVF